MIHLVRIAEITIAILLAELILTVLFRREQE
jgi:hypothetical protein